MKIYDIKRISVMCIISNALLLILFCVSESQLFYRISGVLHDVSVVSGLLVMILNLILIPYWVYRIICTVSDKKKETWSPINVCALVFNFIGYAFLRHIVYTPFVDWVMIISLVVFLIRRLIWKLKSTSRIIAVCTALVISVAGLAVLFSPYYNPFDLTVEYDKKTYHTEFGDKITFIYEEYNFPDASCTLTISDSECEDYVYLVSDPPRHWIELIDMVQQGENNIYISNDVFLVKNTRTKEFTKREIEELIPKDAFEAYEKNREIIKKIICSGNIYWVVAYSEPFIINGDVDVINTVVNIGNADTNLADEPEWVGGDSHINAMYQKKIDVRCPDESIREKDLSASEEYFYAIDLCKALIEKYNLKYIGENTIHDNCREG